MQEATDEGASTAPTNGTTNSPAIPEPLSQPGAVCPIPPISLTPFTSRLYVEPLPVPPHIQQYHPAILSPLTQSFSQDPSTVPQPHPPQQQQQPTASASAAPANANQAMAGSGPGPGHSTASSPAPAAARGSPHLGQQAQAAALPTQPAIHGSPTRIYLNTNVTPHLLEGMKYLAVNEPEKPLKWLSEFLAQKSVEIEGA
ncbi:hypothetical protein P152DRAFT_477606 [Eremomyces bilateralis CBS 781.70]|uniref:Uncharacterized protein n=1 Tax=Eremomyces bilateralis CBS 781.70 TaxID=1392243 RepID=A0A6G1FQW2_9PEZI|nr:uncharacterized protein P152DRAFT_477606 [Eremomyces bilateralis CBS 781.70]KAF1808136.1 hypothetical protein P152DRAFT_477606 [Eremomyces bilateralis CBS 781.70]